MLKEPPNHRCALLRDRFDYTTEKSKMIVAYMRINQFLSHVKGDLRDSGSGRSWQVPDVWHPQSPGQAVIHHPVVPYGLTHTDYIQQMRKKSKRREHFLSQVSFARR